MHVELTQLWMPIVASAVAVFIASSLFWMVLPLHKNDYKKIPNEAGMMDAVRSHSLGGGLYMFPACDPKTLKSDPAAKERYDKGPWGSLTLAGAKPNMGAMMPLWFVYLALVSLFSAYLGSLALPAGASFMKVMQATGAAAFMPYALACMPMSIWEMKPWPFTFKHMFDGVVYALVTGAIFGWLWPHAATATEAAGQLLGR